MTPLTHITITNVNWMYIADRWATCLPFSDITHIKSFAGTTWTMEIVRQLLFKNDEKKYQLSLHLNTSLPFVYIETGPRMLTIFLVIISHIHKNQHNCYFSEALVMYSI